MSVSSSIDVWLAAVAVDESEATLVDIASESESDTDDSSADTG